MSDNNQAYSRPLQFGPANDEVFDYFTLDGLFDDDYFPPELDFSSIFSEHQGMPIPGVGLMKGVTGMKNGASEFNDIVNFQNSAASGADITVSSSSKNNISDNQSNCRILNNSSVIVVPPPSSSSGTSIHFPNNVPNVTTSSNVNKTSSSSRSGNTSNNKHGVEELDDDDDDDSDDDDDDDDNQGSRKKRKTSKVGRIDTKSMTHQQKLERRERNREHAKRSRIRKKVLLDSLQHQLTALRDENMKLRSTVAEKLPEKAQDILDECTTQESLLLSGFGKQELLDLNDSGNVTYSEKGMPLRQGAKILVEPDFRLIQSLITCQSNFVVSDPSLPDNPIVYASEGFCKLSGYKRQDILGRNCRFLQGPGTDQAAVDIIRKGVEDGQDISVCLLNYKADGSPFWNQFFVAALKDSDGLIVNYVGVQCEVNTLPINELKDRVKKLPMPENM